jgi:AcrR family transcriptional regulator
MVPKLIDHGQRRQQIVHAAWSLIAKQGLEAVTFRQVAAQAKLVPGSVRFMFATQEDLLRGLAGDLVAEMRVQHRERANRYPRSDMLASRLIASLPLDVGMVVQLWKVEKALRLSAARHRQFAEVLAACRELRVVECQDVLTTLAGESELPNGAFGLEVLRTYSFLEGLGDLLVEAETSPITKDEARDVVRMHVNEVGARWEEGRHSSLSGSPHRRVDTRCDRLQLDGPTA